MWKIGNIEINNQVVLAPMAGICDNAYRTIIKDMGCGLICAEMVSDKAIMYGSKKTIDMLYMTDYERPISQQIFGSDVESFVKAAKYIEEVMKPDIIDINMGCPVPKVALRSQAGSALLKDPKKVFEIVSQVVASVNVPVTVKIRSGWDSNSINAVEIAKIIESAGASAITVHPRTRSQGYSGHADWNIIKEVKENVSIPVIGNGDIKSAFDALRMLETTKCDAIMIGRGVLGNPWLIKETVELLENNKIINMVKPIEKLEMILEHLKRLIATKNEKVALLEIRTHIGYYLKQVPASSELKNQVFKTKSIIELKELIEDFIKRRLYEK